MAQPAKYDSYGRRYVAGAGSTAKRLMVVGEAPGFNEDRSGRPFVGAPGREMERLMKQAGLRMADWYLTNLAKYRPLTDKLSGNNSPTLDDIARDEGDLVREIREVRPKWIAAVGRTAMRWLLNADLDMDDCYGFAFPVVFCIGCGARHVEPQTATEAEIHEKGAEDARRVLELDRSRKRRSIRSLLAKRKERAGPSSVVDDLSRKSRRDRKSDRSSLQQYSLRESTPPASLHAASKYPKKRQPNSRPRSKNALSAQSSLRQEKHVRTEREEARSSLSRMRSHQSPCESCSAETIRFIVVALIHPAAGFHAPETQPLIYWSFQRLGKYLSGEIEPVPPTDKFPNPIYVEINDEVLEEMSNLRRALLVEGAQDSNLLAVGRGNKRQRVRRDRRNKDGQEPVRPSGSVRTVRSADSVRPDDRSSLQRPQLRQPKASGAGIATREQTKRSTAKNFLHERSSEDSRDNVLEEQRETRKTRVELPTLQKGARESLLRSVLPYANRTVAVDTEGYLGGDVWSAQYSFEPGTAALVLTKNKRAVEFFKKILFSNKVILHHAAHDLRVLAEMFGMDLLELLDQIDFEDSMQAAFVLRLVPKGLKALCRRFHGMKMRDYKEVVRAADKKLMVAWLERTIREARCGTCGGAGTVMRAPLHRSTGRPLAERPVKCSTCEGDGTTWEPPEEVLSIKAGKLSVSRGHRMGSRIRALLADRDKRDPKTGKPTDLRSRWYKLKKDSWTFALQVEDKLGPPRQVSLGNIPFDEAKQYACADADGTIRVWPELERDMAADGLRRAYEIDKAIIPMATRAMSVGWKIDVGYLGSLTNKLTVQQDKILYELEDVVGHSINPNSSDQVGHVLFDETGLHPVRITESGTESTDSKVLTDLRIHCAAKMDSSQRHAKAYRVITAILDWKERGKLKSTYTIPLPRLVDADHRLHTDLKLANTESARLASANPNLQNIPSRGELGKLIRKAFICEPGRLLVGVDLSQIEMRVLAHMANEKVLLKAISEGLDVHSLTCQKIFGIPMSEAKGTWQREAAKTLGFGIVYGISAPALKIQIKLQSGKHMKGGIDVPVEQCEEWIEQYTKTTYPAIGDFMMDSVAEARRYGYVSGMFGHRRYLPGVHSPINKVRAEAERIATNHRIQCTAAEIEKLAMAAVWEDVLPKFRKRGYTECLLQEHDALYFETEARLAEELMEEVIRVKCAVVQLKVRITADGHTGSNWKAVKDGSETVKRAVAKLTGGMVH